MVAELGDFCLNAILASSKKPPHSDENDVATHHPVLSSWLSWSELWLMGLHICQVQPLVLKNKAKQEKDSMTVKMAHTCSK